MVVAWRACLPACRFSRAEPTACFLVASPTPVRTCPATMVALAATLVLMSVLMSLRVSTVMPCAFRRLAASSLVMPVLWKASTRAL